MAIDDLFQLSRRYIDTKIKPYQRDFLKTNPFKHRLSILKGQRGTGKTTLIVQHLLNSVNQNKLSSEILYIPTDHFLLSGRALFEIAEEFSLSGGKWIAFDEIHKYPNWSMELKSIYDTFPDLMILASGSSALRIHQASYDLSRRAINYSIRGFSFREYLEIKTNQVFSPVTLTEILNNHEYITDSIVKQSAAVQHKILAEFKQYLKTGYYPYFLEINDTGLYFITIEQNIHTILESDLSVLYPELTGNSIKKIRQLLTFIASHVPFTPNMQKLKNILEIGDERTLKTYLKYLEEAELIKQIPSSSRKLHKLEIPEKIYLDNTNQLYAISANMENVGTIREIFFANMLSYKHKLTVPKMGDFLIDDQILLEIGGKNKDFHQIKDSSNAYLICDDIEFGFKNKIPLWLFGFLY